MTTEQALLVIAEAVERLTAEARRVADAAEALLRRREGRR